MDVTLGHHSETTKRQPKFRQRIWKYRWAYLFIAPFYILFLLFDAFPLAYSAYLSLHRWNGLGSMEFMGLGNYVRAFNDSRFLTSLENTVVLWLGHIFILIALALGLAMILNVAIVRGRSVYRGIIYLPNITPLAAMTLVFGLIFDAQFGILNQGLQAIGLESIPWLVHPVWAKVSIILVNLWNSIGWYMLIFLAGLQSIDLALYDAAAVDGANRWQAIWYVTIPSLRPILFFVFVIETIGSFELFIEPQLLTSGGPLNATLTSSLYLYNTAFQYNKFGYSAALSFILFAIIVTVSFVQSRIMTRDT